MDLLEALTSNGRTKILPESEAQLKNPEQLLWEAAIALNEAKPSPVDKWFIVVRHHKIEAIPSFLATPEEIIIGKVSGYEKREGFTSLKWNHMKEKIHKIQVEGLL